VVGRLRQSRDLSIQLSSSEWPLYGDFTNLEIYWSTQSSGCSVIVVGDVPLCVETSSISRFTGPTQLFRMPPLWGLRQSRDLPVQLSSSRCSIVVVGDVPLCADFINLKIYRSDLVLRGDHRGTVCMRVFIGEVLIG
jgi:hypothetical protein